MTTPNAVMYKGQKYVLAASSSIRGGPTPSHPHGQPPPKKPHKRCEPGTHWNATKNKCEKLSPEDLRHISTALRHSKSALKNPSKDSHAKAAAAHAAAKKHLGARGFRNLSDHHGVVAWGHRHPSDAKKSTSHAKSMNRLSKVHAEGQSVDDILERANPGGLMPSTRRSLK